MIYLDSCALVKLVLTEKETPALLQFLDGRRSEMVSCQLALTEVIRVVRRSCHDPQRQLTVDPEVLTRRLEIAGALLDRIDLVVVDRTMFIAAAMFEDDPFVGSLDAIHLASAQAIGPELTAFVTYDKTLSRAACEVGLPLAQPA
jgi:predicted nucleic acid-binding protein